MSFGVTVALWIILVVSALFDAANTQSVDGSESTLGAENAANLNQILENEPVGVKQIGVGGANVTIPTINPNFIAGVFSFLTWDRSYFKADWNLLRWFFTAITFAFTLFVIKDLTGPVVDIARFLGETAGAVVGGFASVAKGLLFR